MPLKKLGHYSQSPGPCAPEQEAGVPTNEQRYSAEAVRTLNKNFSSTLKRTPGNSQQKEEMWSKNFINTMN
jgi:hypothetical protein